MPRMDSQWFFWILTITLTLLLENLTLANAESLCDRIEGASAPSEDDFKNDIGPWFAEEYSDWKTQKASGDVNAHFWTYFRKKWTSGLAETISACDLSGTCSVVSCEFFKEDFSIDDRVKAYRSLEAITYFHNARWHMREVSTEKFNDIEAAKENIIGKFSDANKAKKVVNDRQAHERLAIHIVTGILLLAAPAVSMAGPFVAAAAAVAAAEGAVGVTAKVAAAAVKDSAVRLTYARVSSGTSMLSAMFYEGQSLASDFMKPSDYLGDLISFLGLAMSKNHHLATKIFTTDMVALLSGNESFSGHTVVDVVQSGYWGSEAGAQFDATPEFEQWTRDAWTASLISNIWVMEHTYIVWSDAPNGCEADNRGLADFRVCLEDYPTSSFWIYFIGRLNDKDRGHHTTLVRGPPGHEFLDQYVPGLDLKTIVKASVAHYEDHGNDFSFDNGNTPTGETFNAYLDPASQLVQKGGRFAGIFMVPVCYMPDGLGISSINLKSSRNYPCMCGEPPKKSAQLGKRKYIQGYPSFEEGFSFLKATGLYQVETWHRLCKAKRLDIHKGMHCDSDESVIWSGKFPNSDHNDDNIRHPFDKCRGRKHKHKGCQGDKNDGSHEETDCG